MAPAVAAKLYTADNKMLIKSVKKKRKFGQENLFLNIYKVLVFILRGKIHCHRVKGFFFVCANKFQHPASLTQSNPENTNCFPSNIIL